MEGTVYKTKADVLKRAKEIEGIPLRKIDKTGRLKTGKGAIGSVIEESWFDYAPNSESEPDFPEAGVELKVTPYIKNKRGDIRAKERLVCNIINYMEEYDKVFKTSSFWHKCETMLLMSYEYIPGIPKSELSIDKAILFSFPEEDLVIIEHDWKTIINKIRSGTAHEISEGDTLYLAACTKGADSKSVRRQPFSDIPAKQRAYSLKVSYMTQILNNYIYGSKENEKIIKDWHVLQDKSLESYIIEKVSPYYGKSQSELKVIFNIDSNAKSLNHLIISRMLGLNDIEKTDEFRKANIIPKTIRVEEDGNIKESMSFPAIDFIELSKEKRWEDSKLYEMLSPTKFLFVIFKKNAEEYYLDRIMFWNMSNDDLDEVEKVWKKTVDTVNKGVVFTKTNRGMSNNLPKQKENRVAHVRPHGLNSSDTVLLPDGREIAKQCFWLNRKYIREQIKKGSDIK